MIVKLYDPMLKSDYFASCESKSSENEYDQSNKNQDYFAATPSPNKQSQQSPVFQTDSYYFNNTIESSSPFIYEDNNNTTTLASSINTPEREENSLEMDVPSSNFDIFKKLIDIEEENRLRQQELKTLTKGTTDTQNALKLSQDNINKTMSEAKLLQANIQKQIIDILAFSQVYNHKITSYYIIRLFSINIYIFPFFFKLGKSRNVKKDGKYERFF